MRKLNFTLDNALRISNKQAIWSSIQVNASLCKYVYRKQKPTKLRFIVKFKFQHVQPINGLCLNVPYIYLRKHS